MKNLLKKLIWRWTDSISKKEFFSLEEEKNKIEKELKSLREALKMLDEHFEYYKKTAKYHCNGVGCLEWEKSSYCNHNILRTTRTVLEVSFFNNSGLRETREIKKNGTIKDLLAEEGIEIPFIVSIKTIKRISIKDIWLD